MTDDCCILNPLANVSANHKIIARSAEGRALDILTASGTLDLCFYDWVPSLSLICKGARRLTSGTSSGESHLSLGSSCTSWQRHWASGESTDIDFSSAFPKTSQGS